MIIFKGKSFSDCYKDSLRYILTNGLENSARGTLNKEVLDVALEIEDPTQCIYSNKVRGSKTNYIAAEFLWYYMGRNDVKFISNWAKFWESIQNEDGTANSAYGDLIFSKKNKFGLSQYQWVLSSLLNDPNTRQAVMHFNSENHQYPKNKDFVCTMYSNFHIRENKLNMSTYMRSNDAIWGTPTDVAFFCSLLMQLKSHLSNFYPNLELGKYTHIANSYHIYDRHYELATNMLEHEFVSERIPEISIDLIDINGEPMPELKVLTDYIVKPNEDILIFQEDDLYRWIFKNLNKV